MQAADTNTITGLPVIVGSSFSGLLLSLQLSETGVEHILIGGDEPNEVPRLGESFNECTSPELFGRFSETNPECFFTKSHIALLDGEYSTAVHFANPYRGEKITSKYNTRSGPWPHKRSRIFWGSVTGRNLMHADRIKLDKVVYQRVIAQPRCRLIKSLVTRVDTRDDSVEKLHLEDGTVIENPRYVMDATGFTGIIANAFEVGVTPTSTLQRVVWTHYHAPEASGIPQRWWRGGTNLVRQEDSVDGYDGISWMIPLGDYISVGVSIDNDRYPEEKYDNGKVMELLNASYERRGIDYTTVFPEHRREICELKHKYFIRDRAYGKNWLLAGGTYIGIWFPSSAGLWTTIAACRLLPHIFDRPEELGKRYEMTLKQLLSSHKLLEDMIHGEPFKSHKQAMRFWSTWLPGVATRLGLYLDLPRPDQPNPPQRFRFMKIWGWICRHIPPIQRYTWGNFVTRTTHCPDYGEQSNAFRGYFQAFPFRMKNYVQCSLRWLNPF